VFVSDTEMDKAGRERKLRPTSAWRKEQDTAQLEKAKEERDKWKRRAQQIGEEAAKADTKANTKAKALKAELRQMKENLAKSERATKRARSKIGAVDEFDTRSELVDHTRATAEVKAQPSETVTHTGYDVQKRGTTLVCG
jgi:predicted nucleotide-binding protein (sugar kinase/HSP70/actin superfamily)